MTHDTANFRSCKGKKKSIVDRLDKATPPKKKPGPQSILRFDRAYLSLPANYLASYIVIKIKYDPVAQWQVLRDEASKI